MLSNWCNDLLRPAKEKKILDLLKIIGLGIDQATHDPKNY